MYERWKSASLIPEHRSRTFVDINIVAILIVDIILPIRCGVNVDGGGAGLLQLVRRVYPLFAGVTLFTL